LKRPQWDFKVKGKEEKSKGGNTTVFPGKEDNIETLIQLKWSIQLP
jgi:hypothetical protein